MGRVDPDLLMTADLAVQGAAALLAVGLGLRTLRQRGLRNPLRNLPSPGPGVGLLEVVLVFGGYLMLTGLAFQIAGLPAADLSRPGSDPWNRAVLIDSAVKVGISALMLVVLSHDALGGVGFGSRRALIAGLATGLIALPVCFAQLQACQTLWQYLWPETPPPVHSVLQAIQDNAWGAPGVALLVVGAVLIAPVSEELFFRGMLLQGLWRRSGGPWRAIAVSAAVFAAIHYPQPQTVVPLFTLGLMLGYLRVRYRSLAACILAHVLFNARTIAIAVLNPQMVM